MGIPLSQEEIRLLADATDFLSVRASYVSLDAIIQALEPHDDTHPNQSNARSIPQKILGKTDGRYEEE